jgi:hypothetical protein
MATCMHMKRENSSGKIVACDPVDPSPERLPAMYDSSLPR